MKNKGKPPQWGLFGVQKMRIIKTTEIDGLKVIHAIDDEKQTPEQEAALWAELCRVICTLL